MARWKPVFRREGVIRFALPVVLSVPALGIPIAFAGVSAAGAATTTTLSNINTGCGVASLSSSYPMPIATVTVTLPTFYAYVSVEGTLVCGYRSNSTVTATPVDVNGPQATTLTVVPGANGSIPVAVKFVGPNQFQFDLATSPTQYSGTYTLTGGDILVLSGTGRFGNQLTTLVKFSVGGLPNFQYAVAISSKGISPLSLAVIIALVIDALLALAGGYLQRLTSGIAGAERALLAGAGDNEEEEEEGGTLGFSGEGPELTPGSGGAALPEPTTGHVITRARWSDDD